MQIREFQQTILRWYKKNRRDMPWRNTENPYKILVSEVMLQQTRVSRVIPKYKEFLKAFPAPQSLAKASTAKLLKTWHGLGYWRRALHLREASQQIMQKYNGKFPRDPKILETLPGIGRYTARAVACFAFQNPDAFIDTNIRRIYLHFFFPKRVNVSDKEILIVAQKAVWKKDPREWHYALFDYGATILTDKKINKRSRHYHKQSKFEGSFRALRTKTLKFILAKGDHGTTEKEIKHTLKKDLRNTSYTSRQILASLQKDGLIHKLTKNTYIV